VKKKGELVERSLSDFALRSQAVDGQSDLEKRTQTVRREVLEWRLAVRAERQKLGKERAKAWVIFGVY
jgi:hypothetical protein